MILRITLDSSICVSRSVYRTSVSYDRKLVSLCNSAKIMNETIAAPKGMFNDQLRWGYPKQPFALQLLLRCCPFMFVKTGVSFRIFFVSPGSAS